MNHIFFFNDTATTEIYTLSLHDALPIYERNGAVGQRDPELTDEVAAGRDLGRNGGEAVGEVRARKLIEEDDDAGCDQGEVEDGERLAGEVVVADGEHRARKHALAGLGR